MAGRENPFSREYSTGNSSESSGFQNPILEERELKKYSYIPKLIRKKSNGISKYMICYIPVGAPKIAGDNSKGFSPINVPN